jgi:hypothetical protein
MMSDPVDMGNFARSLTRTGAARRRDRTPPISLFLLFLQETISERPRFRRRNPGFCLSGKQT